MVLFGRPGGGEGVTQPRFPPPCAHVCSHLIVQQTSQSKFFEYPLSFQSVKLDSLEFIGRGENSFSYLKTKPIRIWIKSSFLTCHTPTDHPFVIATEHYHFLSLSIFDNLLKTDGANCSWNEVPHEIIKSLPLKSPTNNIRFLPASWRYTTPGALRRFWCDTDIKFKPVCGHVEWLISWLPSQLDSSLFPLSFNTSSVGWTLLTKPNS